MHRMKRGHHLTGRHVSADGVAAGGRAGCLWGRQVALIAVALCAVYSVPVAVANDVLPDDGEYVTMDSQGHLQLHGERVRFWGVTSSFIGWANKRMPHGWNGQDQNPPEVVARKTEAMRRDLGQEAKRFADLGFNMYRLTHQVTDAPFVEGDGSYHDMMAFYLNELDKNGLKVWNATLKQVCVQPEDVNILDDPATARAWTDAVARQCASFRKGTTTQYVPEGAMPLGVQRAWDPRSRAVALQLYKRQADIRNPYRNNLRRADDPQMAVWELEDREWWFSSMAQGQWRKLDPFFQEQLLDRWHGFLMKKYADEQQLRKAWLALLDGESLADGTVQLLPMQPALSGYCAPARAGKAAREVLAATFERAYGRDDFNRQRGSDVIEFLLAMWIEYKVEMRDAVKGFGKSCRLSPWVLDAGQPDNIHSLYLHQHGDASTVNCYNTGIHADRNHKRFPWNSGLEELPRLGWNAPWPESNRIPGKGFFMFEAAIEKPAKYRAEYPYRVAALASIQDADIVCWSAFDKYVAESSVPLPDYQKKLDAHRPGIRHKEGYHFGSDEVMLAALATAGDIFKNGNLRPAPVPTTFTFGRTHLLDPGSLDYGGSFGDYRRQIMPTTYRYGSRMLVDPASERATVKGKVVTERVYEPCPIKPTDEISYDWQRGFLKCDAPSTVAFVGFLGVGARSVAFTHGVAMEAVIIKNDEGMPYPVTEEECYVAFGLSARDGKPFRESKEVMMTLVSTSFNRGFALNAEKLVYDHVWEKNEGAVSNFGGTPVLSARVGAKLVAKDLDGMSYSFLDWDLKELKKGVVEGGILEIPADKRVFVVKLTRP